MENRAHAIVAGVFVLLLCLAAVAGLWWFGERDLPRADYLVVTRGNVTGLTPQGNVRYRGIQVGKVSSIRINERDPGEILIRVRVLKDVPITDRTRAQLAYQGVTGIAHILLVDGSNGKGLPLVAEAGSPPRIPMEASFFDRLGDAGGNVIQQSGELLVRAQKLLDEDNQRAIQRILENLEKSTAHLAAVGQRVVPLAGRLDGVVADTQQLIGDESRERLANSLDSFARASDSAAEAFVRWQRLADDFGVLAKRLDDAATRMAGDRGVAGVARRVERLAAELEATSGRLNRILADLEESPNSLLVGAPRVAPGPGEDGYRAPPAGK